MDRLMSLDFGKELLGVALIVVVAGLVLHLVSVEIYGAHNLNDMKVYGAHLVVTGILAHLVCELTGINHWYCKNGLACKV